MSPQEFRALYESRETSMDACDAVAKNSPKVETPESRMRRDTSYAVLNRINETIETELKEMSLETLISIRDGKA